MLLTIPAGPLCVDPPTPPTTLRVRFPFGIQLESVRNSIRRIPSQDELLIPQLGMLNAVLAPFTPILSIAALLVAIIDAIKAVPDAISSLDPSLITDALAEVASKAAPLAQFVPGMPYVIMARDFLNVFRVTVTEVLGIVTELRSGLARIQAATAALVDMNPEAAADLRAHLACALADIQARQTNLAQGLSLLKTIICALTIPLKIIETFLPQDARNAVKGARCSLRALFELPGFTDGLLLEAQLEDTDTVLQTVESALSEAVSITVGLEGVFSRLIGETPGSTPTSIECFSDCT